MIPDVGLRFKYSHQKFRSNSLLGLSLGCIQPDLKFDLRSKSRTTLIRSLTSDSIRGSIQNLEKLHHIICNGLLLFLLLVQCAFDAIQGLNLESWASHMVVKWKIRYWFFFPEAKFHNLISYQSHQGYLCRRSCKIFASCVNFLSRKQPPFLHFFCCVTKIYSPIL